MMPSANPMTGTWTYSARTTAATRRKRRCRCIAVETAATAAATDCEDARRGEAFKLEGGVSRCRVGVDQDDLAVREGLHLVGRGVLHLAATRGDD